MKRLISYLSSWHSLLLMLMMLTVTACVDDNDDTEAPYLEVSPTSLTFGEDGKPTADSQDYFEVKTNRPWKITVQDDATWLTLSKTTGDGDAQISVSVPAGTSGTAKVDVQIVNSSGVLMSETVTVKSFGADEPIVPDTPTAVIFNETVGDDASASDKPYVDAYTGWKKTGEGAANVTYGSSGKVSVRNSGLSNSGAYEGASGPNVVFFGTAPTTFYINKIALTSEQKKLKLTFGASYSLKSDDTGEYVNTFDTSLFKVSVSNDGSKWIPITYTKNKGDEATPYWVLATADFTLKQATTELYIKFDTEVSSAIRLDDITLATGEGGQEVDFEAAAETPAEAKVITIAEINAMMAEDGPVIDATADRYFEAVVQCDVEGGNYTNNNLQVAAEGASKAGEGVTLYGSQVDPKTLGLNKGDKIKVTLKAGLATAKLYSGLNEVTGGKNETWCVIEKIGTAEITPVAIAPDQLAGYQAMTVVVKNAAPAAANTWVIENYGTNTFAADGKEFAVFCKQGSVFDGQSFTVATGDIVGIASVYKNNSQLVPRNLDDVKAFMGSGEEPKPSEKSAIATLLEMYAAGTTALSADMEFEAIVSGDPKGGNFSYGTLYIMTEGATTGGEGITLYNNKVDVSANYALGDKVKVSLKAANVTLGAYNGITQITGWEAADVVVVSSGHTVTPIEITPAQMAEYYSMPVTIKNVTTAEGNIWKNSGSASNMSTQFTVNGEALVVYLNKNATGFDGLSYKATTGSLTGIVGAYKSTPQLLPRNVEDAADFMDNGSTEEPDPTPDTPSTEATYESIAAFNFANGTNVGSASEADIIIGESTFKGVKLGTSKKAGTFTSAAVGVTGDKTLSFYAVAWKGKTATLYVRVDNGGEVSGANGIALTANEGASNNSPFTVTFAGSDYYSVSLKGLTENSTITISTTDTFDDASSSAGRAVMCGFQLK
ncbi:MAG: BACON domain-containing protein [Bacteroides sp.]|nr:BACON domain-containing protein [Bacteroides sp.]